MTEAFRHKLSRFLAVWQLAAPDSTELQQRNLRMERNIILPARVAVILILYYSFVFSPWIRYAAYSLDVGVETVVSLFWVYVGAVALGAILLGFSRRIPTSVARGAVVLGSLLDALFLAGLTLITGGYDSILYWVFVVLVVRNTVTEPLSPVQWATNLFTAGSYLLAGVSDYVLAGSVDEPTRQMLELSPAGRPAEVLVVRTVLLLLVAACGFGVQLLLERQRRAEEESREFSLRENQLRSTGRLAAEIAHQLKNPLAIISNTTFSLQRTVQAAAPEVSRFTRIIREEIERADRILTQVMGYARLTEGAIEKLDVASAVDAAVAEVFPDGTEFDVTIHRSYQPNLPRLMMQREHLREILVNLLANARDACLESGVILLQVRSPERGTVEIVVEDNGCGIARDQQRRMFEAYYTTKPKGTGLGLAIVRNNAELYGGSVQVESELGKGARFTLIFPVTGSTLSRA
jgi:signal transduction histidine kinase